MVFSSPIFLFCFLPIVLAAYFACPRAARNGVLLVFSLLFYAWGEAYYVLLIVASILFNWTIGQAIDGAWSPRRRALWLGAGVAGNLLVLGFFKYVNFAVLNLNQLFAWLKLPLAMPDPGILLPLGISFFTFHSISYLIDVKRGSASVEKNLGTFALYILLFPQLIAGPIVRWKTIFSQFRSRRETVTDFAWGANRFVFGLAKKTLIANPLGYAADAIFALPPGQLSPGAAWLGVVSYTLQIYFDFSGYSDMAIGLMRMFGFRILENFDYPYVSRSIREFWRRWHISLSTFFRDYVYIPLGGSRGSLARTCANIVIVFGLSGLWHGANWTFVVWGLWHGSLICIETLGFARVLDRLGRLAHLYGLFAVMAGWVIFRSPSLDHAFAYYGALFGLNRLPATAFAATYLDNQVLLALAAGIVGALPVARLARAVIDRATPDPWSTTFNGIRLAVLAALIVLSAATLAATSYNPFIYFRF